MSRDWPFGVRAYYANDVKRPKHPGDLAIETKHRNEGSLYTEVLAAQSRPDIGRVTWWGPVSDHTRNLLAQAGVP